MAFEGEHKVIPIKGIARAGADTVCEDGAMNEVIGLEYKDGSYVPYKPTQKYDIQYPQGVVAIYIHNTSKGRVLVSVLSDRIMWSFEETINWKTLAMSVGKLVFIGDTVSILSTEKIVTYAFNGKTYILYNTTLAKYNANLLRMRVTRGLAGHDKVKNQDGWLDDPISVQYLSSHRYGDIGDKAASIKTRFDEIISVSEDVSLGSSLITRAQGMLSERGGLSGYFLVCYAFRLTSGDIVQASHPILMCPPAILQDGNLTSHIYDEYSDTYVLYKNKDQVTTDGVAAGTELSEQTITVEEGSRMIDLPNVGVSSAVTVDGKVILSSKTEPKEIEGVSSTKSQYVYLTDYFNQKDWETIHEGTGNSEVKWFFPLCYKGGVDEVGSVIDDYDEKDVDLSKLAKTSPVPFTSSITMHVRNGQIQGANSDDSFQYDDIYKTVTCSGLSNKLQISIDESLAKSLPNTVSSVCIFISPEISPFFDTTKDDNVNVHGLFVGGKLGYTGTTTSNNVRFMHTFTPKYRSKELILEDIKNITSMYKVKEIPIEELKKMSEDKFAKGEAKWIDVDLRGLLGDTLLTLETLPITAFDYTEYAGNVGYSNNYRLHIGDISRIIYRGYSRESLWNSINNGRGQFNNGSNANSGALEDSLGDVSVRNVVTKTYIRNEDSSESVVVSYDYPLNSDKSIWGLNSVIIYPNPNAYKMEIYIDKTDSDGVKTIDLLPNKRLGFSYYINPKLKPITISDFDSTTNTIPTLSDSSNDVRRATNVMRVSATASPHILPVENTYRIGNGKILGLARITIALASDNYGTNQLLIFCTDGIYTMGVDTTGTGAYSTSPAMFSNEICVNANSICEINGGVVFASNRGLLVATQNGVVDFSPAINGEPRQYPRETVDFGLGMKLYHNMLTANNLLDNVSKENFINFIKDSNTRIVYISEKNKLYIYNSKYGSDNKELSYLVDIETRIATKLSMAFDTNDNDYIHPLFMKGTSFYRFDYDMSQYENVDVLLQTRPIKLSGGFKNAIRVILRGRYEVDHGYASLLVMGSLDGEIWQPIGVKERRWDYGNLFHDIGCVTDKVSCKYLMIIFTGNLKKNSHIDGIELTIDNQYNNKLR